MTIPESFDTPELLALRELAIAGADQASIGASGLLTYVKEGDCSLQSAFPEETIEKLADALKIALEIDLHLYGDDPDGMKGQLLAAHVRFLEGWAG
jgi:hypothetical protein